MLYESIILSRESDLNGPHTDSELSTIERKLLQASEVYFELASTEKDMDPKIVLFFDGNIWRPTVIHSGQASTDLPFYMRFRESRQNPYTVGFIEDLLENPLWGNNADSFQAVDITDSIWANW